MEALRATLGELRQMQADGLLEAEEVAALKAEAVARWRREQDMKENREHALLGAWARCSYKSLCAVKQKRPS